MPEQPLAMAPEANVRLVDGRHLEPPEPFVRTMEALDTIVPGQQVRLLLAREPFPLYRALELNGYTWRTEHLPDGDVEILIWHAAGTSPVQPAA